MSNYEVQWDGTRATLPRANAADQYEAMPFGIWEKENQSRFVSAARAVARKGRGPVLTDLCLVPRPDNDYNEYAVAVSTPPSEGAQQELHLGYLYDRILTRIGFARLPNLARYSGGVVYCTGLVYNKSSDGLVLDLPSPEILADAIDRFLKAGSTPPLSSMPLLPGTEAQAAAAKERTAEALKSITQFHEPGSPVEDLILETLPSHHSQPRSIGLSDAKTGRHLGSVHRGMLLLFDERDRDQILPLLAKHGLPVKQPLVSLSASAIVSNIATIDGLRTIQFRANGASFPAYDDLVAHYNRGTRTLWAQDADLIEPCLQVASRLGIQVRATHVPSRAWRLEEEVPRSEWGDYKTIPGLTQLPIPMPELSKTARGLVPAPLLAGLNFRDVPGHKFASDDPADMLITLEQHVPERLTCFGRHQMTGEIGACRFCGRESAIFRVDLVSEPLAYCQTCLNYAVRGNLVKRERAIEAIRLVAELEYGGEAMLEAQFRRLRFDPADQIQAAEVDRRLLLRLFVPKNRWSWTRLLSDADLANQGIRMSRGTVIRAQDGHLCLSKGEKLVDDFLHQHGIEHEREPLYPFDREFNANGRRRADWILFDGTFVELWGMPKVPEYAMKMDEKIRLAERHGINMIELTEAQLPNLLGIFDVWLRKPREPIGDGHRP